MAQCQFVHQEQGSSAQQGQLEFIPMEQLEFIQLEQLVSIQQEQELVQLGPIGQEQRSPRYQGSVRLGQILLQCWQVVSVQLEQQFPQGQWWVFAQQGQIRFQSWEQILMYQLMQIQLKSLTPFPGYFPHPNDGSKMPSWLRVPLPQSQQAILHQLDELCLQNSFILIPSQLCRD